MQNNVKGKDIRKGMLFVFLALLEVIGAFMLIFSVGGSALFWAIVKVVFGIELILTSTFTFRLGSAFFKTEE